MPADPFIDVLSAVTDSLTDTGIPHAITGSIASSVFGEPFVSQDVDIAVRMTAEQAGALASKLPGRFYRTADHLIEVARCGGLAHLIDTASGLKVDLSVLPNTPFYDAVMQRRALMPIGPAGPSFYFVTAEDVIVMKLLWRRDTQSQKQWDNALSVARVQGARLDWPYLFRQADGLQLAADLVRLRDEAGV